MGRARAARQRRDPPEVPHEKYKLTDEDYRNREPWNDYAVAADETVERTDTAAAPRVLVPANDERFGRIMVLEAVRAALKQAC